MFQESSVRPIWWLTVSVATVPETVRTWYAWIGSAGKTPCGSQNLSREENYGESLNSPRVTVLPGTP